jgi:hypothetical protein
MCGCGLALISVCSTLAPAAQAAPRGPLVMEHDVTGPLVGGGQREFIEFSLQSRKACDRACRRAGGARGYARILMPRPQTETTPPFSSFFLGYGDGIDTPQIQDSKLSGYVTSGKGSCSRLRLEEAKALRFIEVRYRCVRGGRFTVTYSPRIDLWDVDDSGTDRWRFGLRYRRSVDKRWALLGSRPEVEVWPFAIEPPNTLYEAPARLVKTEVDSTTATPIVYFTTNGHTDLGVKVRSTHQVGGLPAAPSGFFTVDGAGNPVPLTANLDAIDNLRSVDQPPLVINDCSVAEACRLSGDHFAEVKLVAPAGVFGLDPETAWAVIFDTTSALTGWAGAAADCSAAGGVFRPEDGNTPNGEGPQDWRCEFAAARNASSAEIARIMQLWGPGSQCASRRLRAVENWNPAGDDYIWCPRSF